MSYKRPHRYDVIDKAYPVRITIEVDPAQNALVQRALRRTVGERGYAVTPARLWSARKAYHLHLYSTYDAMMFLSACPQAKLVWEAYEGNAR